MKKREKDGEPFKKAIFGAFPLAQSIGL